MVFKKLKKKTLHKMSIANLEKRRASILNSWDNAKKAVDRKRTKYAEKVDKEFSAVNQLNRELKRKRTTKKKKKSKKGRKK